MDSSPHPPIQDNTGRGEPSGRPASAAHKSTLDELAQWERFALNRLDRDEAGRPFEVKDLPDELAFEVSAGLLFARDRKSVKSVFAGARAEL